MLQPLLVKQHIRILIVARAAEAGALELGHLERGDNVVVELVPLVLIALEEFLPRRRLRTLPNQLQLTKSISMIILLLHIYK